MLATSHRQENVDDKERFACIIKGLQSVQSEFGVPLIYPIHPRARKQLELFGIDIKGLTLVEPLDYLSFLNLESKSLLVLSDSGGVQEETCVLGVPCVTLRDNTERPEVGREKGWVNPFGDWKIAQIIIRILTKNSS
jgi:UDP-N-acetylglucosamine 2-epimerase (non-hydrolysing)